MNMKVKLTPLYYEDLQATFLSADTPLLRYLPTQPCQSRTLSSPQTVLSCMHTLESCLFPPDAPREAAQAGRSGLAIRNYEQGRS